MTASLARLLDEHDGIGTRARAILLLLDEDEAQPGRAAGMLGELKATIADHVAYEEQFIYPEMSKAGSADLSDTAEMFAEEFVALRGDWVGYLDAWPDTAIGGDWPGFAAATRAILPRMLDRVRRENDCLYPLALRRGAVRLR
ncbi:MAG: hemerythrin domain-containing protein [Sphingomonadaceae bacterium]|nr:hemerythrin domain-containing protein [Sphingomonadaceae bacterium]